MEKEKTIMATITGEYFQPVRLHYTVFDQQKLLQAFKKLRCIEFDATRNRWVWLYDCEAKTLTFQKSHPELPTHMRPIVLGSIFLRGKDRMLLDARSCERALEAIPFFDNYIPRSVAKVREAEVANKLCSTDNPALTPDSLFDSQPRTRRDSEAGVQEMLKRASSSNNPVEQLRNITDQMNNQAKRSLPEVERIPIHYYEDGIHGFDLALKLRQIVARQHWLAHAEYTLSDAIEALYQST
jgi:hypothetical protein